MLTLYNTLTGNKEVFVPLNPDVVGVYVCGVTVYDFCHIGHARTYTSADLLVRYLQYRGYQVNYVRNITDIDDKIIHRANENNESIQSLSSRFTQYMHEDFDALQLIKPNHEPKATEFVPQMITLIERMIENGYAYLASNQDVYFSVRSFPNYGCLSHHNIDQLESGARVEVDEIKRDPLDFVLWKSAKPGEPSWNSPWGEGRPGWHIECSAMSMQLLGETFDIHGGGRDLIFPHHENEIAQSEAATRNTFAKYWTHGGLLQVSDIKMSKSLGNFVTIRDVLAKHDAEVVRLLFISSQYRSPLVYTEDALHQSKQSLTRFYTTLRHLNLQQGEDLTESQYETQFIAAMDDDLNTPVALSVLFDLAHEVNRLKESDLTSAISHARLLKRLLQMLGLIQKDIEAYFKAGSSIDAMEIERLIAERNQARAEKNWARADEIRKHLLTNQILIEDGQQGTSWRLIN